MPPLNKVLDTHQRRIERRIFNSPFSLSKAKILNSVLEVSSETVDVSFPLVFDDFGKSSQFDQLSINYLTINRAVRTLIMKCKKQELKSAENDFLRCSWTVHIKQELIDQPKRKIK